MGREFELKFAADPQKQEKILEEYGAFAEISMETVYYDTQDGDFARRHMTLRRRLENERSVCTLKAPAGENCRREFEVEQARLEDGIAELCKLSGWSEMERLAAKGLKAVCGARFLRKARALTLPECEVELALDRGVLLGGGREMPLCEVEVELKSGNEEAAAVFALALAARFGLRPEGKSKFARARELAVQEEGMGN